MLILIAMNNLWTLHLKAKTGEGDPKQQQQQQLETNECVEEAETSARIERTFEEFAKIFFCDNIRFEDIITNLKECQHPEIAIVTYPFVF